MKSDSFIYCVRRCVTFKGQTIFWPHRVVKTPVLRMSQNTFLFFVFYHFLIVFIWFVGLSFCFKCQLISLIFSLWFLASKWEDSHQLLCSLNSWRFLSQTAARYFFFTLSLKYKHTWLWARKELSKLFTFCPSFYGRFIHGTMYRFYYGSSHKLVSGSLPHSQLFEKEMGGIKAKYTCSKSCEKSTDL